MQYTKKKLTKKMQYGPAMENQAREIGALLRKSNSMLTRVSEKLVFMSELIIHFQGHHLMTFYLKKFLIMAIT